MLMDYVIDFRHEERKAVILPAKYRTASGMRDVAKISDISAQGCLLSVTSPFFRVGTRVSIRPEGMEAISGTARWLDDTHVGIEFDHPLYIPVVDHLAAIFSDS